MLNHKRRIRAARCVHADVEVLGGDQAARG
jgi:hypothetical protein